jgi:hypothetical protein
MSGAHLADVSPRCRGYLQPDTSRTSGGTGGVPVDTHKFIYYIELLYLIHIYKCSIKPFNINVIMQRYILSK